ncbi:PrsW family intramembrane metalloprotease [Actinocrispum wychmicini]|uniref:RsiW-degrading membrane proteinase PrsW (M82 family) n=1 Tax=Actinocrispum wychmicini TaxID=1213861 RepID=A0A4R2JV23_9PSEU|nr:PrsW family intramembrane metalloprotease [Actinocrispum wychmicini]TCO57995.1 RsiW-degrading membrane proteinase PrsW (M82 family) [Actinocrispum wychmicini]
MTVEESGVRQRPKPRRFTVLLPVVGLIVLSLCGLGVFAYLTARVGLVAELIGLGAALLPVVPVVAVFLWIDRWEPEPAKLLWLAFTWGAFGATLTALLINNTAAVVGDLLLGKGGGDTVSAVVSAPLIEEAAKGAFVLAIFLRRRHEFDGVVDGIVYGGMCAAGFAFTENVYYFGRIFVEHGFGHTGVIGAFILRGVLAPFTHPLFTVMTGIGLGVAATTTRRGIRIAAPIVGYVIAVGLHALWNAAATLGNARTFLNVYFLIMVPVFVGAAALVHWARKREQRIVAAALPEFVREGLVAASETELLGSLRRRLEWRRRIRRKYGPVAARAVADYQVTVTELAFARASHNGREEEYTNAVRVARATAVRAASGH